MVIRSIDYNFVKPTIISRHSIRLHFKVAINMAKLHKNTKASQKKSQKKWDKIVYQPIVDAITDKRTENVNDELHAAEFIMKCLYRDIHGIIDQIGCDRHVDSMNFGSLRLIASAASETVLATLADKIPEFVKWVNHSNNHCSGTVRQIQELFTSLRDKQETRRRLSLLFLRDALYISCPSYVNKVARCDPYMKKKDIQTCLKLLTINMCGKHMHMDSVSNDCLKHVIPLLLFVISQPGGSSFMTKGDSLSLTRARDRTHTVRKDDVNTYLHKLALGQC